MELHNSLYAKAGGCLSSLHILVSKSFWNGICFAISLQQTWNHLKPLSTSWLNKYFLSSAKIMLGRKFLMIDFLRRVFGCEMFLSYLVRVQYLYGGDVGIAVNQKSYDPHPFNENLMTPLNAVSISIKYCWYVNINHG